MYKNICILTGYSVVMPNALNMRNTRINANPIILFLLPVIEFFYKTESNQFRININYCDTDLIR